jgi:hypothetical protein
MNCRFIVWVVYEFCPGIILVPIITRSPVEYIIVNLAVAKST